MNESQFFQFCQLNEGVEFERDSSGNMIILPLRGALFSLLNVNLSGQLWNWNKKNQTGLIFSSSTGFTLPNGAVRSPDVSWVRKEKWNSLSEEQQQFFAPICPDFIIEIHSVPEEKQYLLDKMREYINNGTQLAWLIDYLHDKVYIFNAANEITIKNSLNVILSGESILPGFSLDLGAVINKIRI
ncbi:Uma2 family endonuclease [Dyadobacter sp. UP-52]|uniref:Uma2 family endonuclease n=2 Tax=Dyadobacter subterraneus TaxID=2773304 RepID=A0ABR9W5A1_9BACT|nr:Uma2 family endonuclease [Dyadobacter subterraneus]